MTTPDTMNSLLEWLKLMLKESRTYFPDDDSRRDGYTDAIQDVLEHILGPDEKVI